ncbi:innexin inx2-like [Orussus abietinus]|uniref:innexin inx2-like n=1 Tax=Orussus abietinus TaxID=222816 RepID=UPI0006268018|nr:innexin inx2-like [Orussus abietinus]
MFDLFSPVRDLLITNDIVRIDNVVFKLHCRVTVLLLTVCAILVTAKQYFGEPISCMADESIAKEPINAYCWIYSTFTVSRHLKGIPGRSVASPGVGQALENDEIHYHRYYQWVCFVLGIQAVVFYIPRALWGMWEGGLVAMLSIDLSSPFLGTAWTPERKTQLVDYLTKTNLHTHNLYAIRYFFCELMNLINTVGQIYLLNEFLEGQFTNYGSAVTGFAMETRPYQRVDPMARLFPKVTKCTIHTFGAGGSAQTHDALCILSLNVVNEKVFVLIWFWFIFLAGVGALAVLYRIIVFSQPWTRIYLLRANARSIKGVKVSRVVRELHFGDWFLLQQLARNVNPIVFGELIEELDTFFTSKKPDELTT